MYERSNLGNIRFFKESSLRSSIFLTMCCPSDRTWELELALVLCGYGRYRAVTVDTSRGSHVLLHTQTWRMASAQTIKSWITFNPPVLPWVTKVSAEETRRSRFWYFLFLGPLGIWLYQNDKIKNNPQTVRWSSHGSSLLPAGLFQVTEMKTELLATKEITLIL